MNSIINRANRIRRNIDKAMAADVREMYGPVEQEGATGVTEAVAGAFSIMDDLRAKQARIDELESRLGDANQELTRLRSIVSGQALHLIRIGNELLHASAEPVNGVGS